jgi:hypothetical protein
MSDPKERRCESPSKTITWCDRYADKRDGGDHEPPDYPAAYDHNKLPDHHPVEVSDDFDDCACSD